MSTFEKKRQRLMIRLLTMSMNNALQEAEICSLMADLVLNPKEAEAWRDLTRRHTEHAENKAKIIADKTMAIVNNEVTI